MYLLKHTRIMHKMAIMKGASNARLMLRSDGCRMLLHCRVRGVHLLLLLEHGLMLHHHHHLELRLLLLHVKLLLLRGHLHHESMLLLLPLLLRHGCTSMLRLLLLLLCRYIIHAMLQQLPLEIGDVNTVGCK
jgi:hypothetical protein